MPGEARKRILALGLLTVGIALAARADENTISFLFVCSGSSFAMPLSEDLRFDAFNPSLGALWPGSLAEGNGSHNAPPGANVLPERAGARGSGAGRDAGGMFQFGSLAIDSGGAIREDRFARHTSGAGSPLEGVLAFRFTSADTIAFRANGAGAYTLTSVNRSALSRSATASLLGPVAVDDTYDPAAANTHAGSAFSTQR